MKTFLVIVLVIALLVAGVWWYLHATTPSESTRVRMPLTPAQRNLVAAVPADAEAFAVIPSAAALHAKLLAHPVTREPIEDWSADANLPSPWMLGGADVVVWKSGKVTSYAVNLDPFRALLARFYLRTAGGGDAGTTTLLINPQGTLSAERWADIEKLAAALPAADMLVVQPAQSRGAYPPIGRPAVTAVEVSPEEIVLTSRAAATSKTPAAPIPARLASGALMSAAFASPPRVLGDLDRLTGSSISALLKDGGSIVIYDIDTGTLLPRPKGVIVTTASAEKRAAVDRIRNVAETFGEIREEGGQIAIALDRSSMATFTAEQFSSPPWPATEWAFRADAERLVPVVNQLADSTGLRLAAGRTYRAARDLRRWIQYLGRAESIEAVQSRSGEAEELRVRIQSK